MFHWTGRTVQTVQVKGRPDAEMWMQESRGVGSLWVCVYFINTGNRLELEPARPPSAMWGGCPLLCGRVLLIHHCVPRRRHAVPWHRFWSSLTMTWCCRVNARMWRLPRFHSDRNRVLTDCVSDGRRRFESLAGVGTCRPSTSLSRELKTGNGCTLSASLRSPAPRCLCAVRLLKTCSRFLPLFFFMFSFLRDAVAGETLWWPIPTVIFQLDWWVCVHAVWASGKHTLV